MYKGHNLLIGAKTASVRFYATQRFKDRLKREWDFREFPDTARLKRDPKDPRKLIPFKSERDFLETILRTVFLTGRFDFDFWMERNNPDHPDFPEEV